MKYILILLLPLGAIAQKDSAILLEPSLYDKGLSFSSTSNIIVEDSLGNSIDFDLTNDTVHINGDTTLALKFAMRQIASFLQTISTIQQTINKR